MLAIQNITGLLRPPLDKLLGGHFPSDAGSSVVGMKKTGGDNERVRVAMLALCLSPDLPTVQWHILATKAGYTFQNLGTGLYLGISTESDREQGRILQGVLKPYYWWINPVTSQPNQGSPVYQ